MGRRRTVRLIYTTSQATKWGAATVAMGWLFAACAVANPAVPRPSASEPLYQQRPAVTAECLIEGKALPFRCNDPRWLPWCDTEDSGIDGSVNDPCYWIDIDTGQIWYDDGDGRRRG